MMLIEYIVTRQLRNKEQADPTRHSAREDCRLMDLQDCFRILADDSADNLVIYTRILLAEFKNVLAVPFHRASNASEISSLISLENLSLE